MIMRIGGKRLQNSITFNRVRGTSSECCQISFRDVARSLFQEIYIFDKLFVEFDRILNRLINITEMSISENCVSTSSDFY